MPGPLPSRAAVATLMHACSYVSQMTRHELHECRSHSSSGPDPVCICPQPLSAIFHTFDVTTLPPAVPFHHRMHPAKWGRESENESGLVPWFQLSTQSLFVDGLGALEASRSTGECIRTWSCYPVAPWSV